jgi:hypothetical protein
MEDILPSLFTYRSGDELASPSWELNTYTDIHIVDNGDESGEKRFEVRQYKHYDPSDDHLWILQTLGHHETLRGCNARCYAILRQGVSIQGIVRPKISIYWG